MPDAAGVSTNLTWARHVAPSCFVSALGGLALMNYQLPYERAQYYCIAVIVIGLGAGFFLDRAQDEHLGRRFAIALIPAAMPLGWMAHCALIGAAKCAMSGFEIADISSLAKLLFVWLVLATAITIGSFAWPLPLRTIAVLTQREVNEKVKRMTRLVGGFGAFLAAIAMLAYRYLPQLSK